MAAAFAAARDTPRIAFAPRRFLFAVPSSSTMISSMVICSVTSRPTSASAISTFTESTASSTPLPRYRFLSPSRLSTASCAPVDAPDGTAARPCWPPPRVTSTSMVGLPRLSRISRANTSMITLIPSSLEQLAGSIAVVRDNGNAGQARTPATRSSPPRAAVIPQPSPRK